MIGGEDSDGNCELFNYSHFQQISKHPFNNINCFGISQGENYLLTFGGHTNNWTKGN